MTFVADRPELIMGVLADSPCPDPGFPGNIIALDKPGGMDTFNTHFYKSGYPPMYDMGKFYWPDGAHTHRIDRFTSGVHMWGTGEATRWIIRNWKTHVHKTYLAIIDKKPKWGSCIVEMNIPAPKGGPGWCTTTLTVLDSLEDGQTLVQCELTKGGRNHQIRRALSSVGFPIQGDKMYGSKSESPRKDAEGRSQYMLHAYQIDVEGWGTVRAATPPEFPIQAEGTPWKWAFTVPPMDKEQWTAWDDFRNVTKKGTLDWTPSEGKKLWVTSRVQAIELV